MNSSNFVFVCQVCGGERLSGDILCADCFVPLSKRPSLFGVPSEPEPTKVKADGADNGLASRKPGRYDLSELEAAADRKVKANGDSGEDRDTPPEVLVLDAIRTSLKNGNYGRCQSCGTVFNPRATSLCPLCRR